MNKKELTVISVRSPARYTKSGIFKCFDVDYYNELTVISREEFERQINIKASKRLK